MVVANRLPINVYFCVQRHKWIKLTDATKWVHRERKLPVCCRSGYRAKERENATSLRTVKANMQVTGAKVRENSNSGLLFGVLLTHNRSGKMEKNKKIKRSKYSGWW